MSQSPKAKKTEEHAAKAQSAVKVAFPLLSIDPLKPVALSAAETYGRFEAQGVGYEGLPNILKQVEGQTDHRGSIPDIYSQAKAFAQTLIGYSNNRSAAAVQSWRGALCLALLYPTLFTAERMPFWRLNGDPREEDQKLMAALASILDGSPRMIALSILNENRDRVFPLLSYDATCVVVPTAYGVSEELKKDVPWLKKGRGRMLHFIDPLPYLGRHQLMLLLLGLNDIRSHWNYDVKEALRCFILDVEQKLREEEETSPTDEAALVEALMLRNSVDFDLHVLKPATKDAAFHTFNAWQESLPRNRSAEQDEKAALWSRLLGDRDRLETLIATEQDSGLSLENVEQSEKCSTSEATAPILKRPIFSSLINITDRLTEDLRYTVALNGHLIAHLDAKHLLWCVCPQTETSRALLAPLKARFADESFDDQKKYLLRFKASKLRENIHFADARVLRHIEQQRGAFGMDAKQSHNVLAPIQWTLVKADEREADLRFAPSGLSNDFSDLALPAVVHEAPETAFSKKVLVTNRLTSGLDKNAHAMPSCLLEIQNSNYFAVPPVDLYGALLLLRNPGITLHLNSKNADSVLPGSIQAEMCYQEGPFVYTCSHRFEETGAVEPVLNSANLPSLAVWPNVRENADPMRTAAWRLYYTFLHFHSGDAQNHFESRVFDVTGKESPPSKRYEIKEPHGFTQITSPDSKPGFLLLEYNRISAGGILLSDDHDKALHPGSQKMVLAVDFGTTASIGAIREALSTTAPPFPMLEENGIGWLMNQRMGEIQAEKHFIAKELGTFGGGKTIFSILKSDPNFFSSPRSVHMGANIQYVSKETAHLENAQTDLKLKVSPDCDNINYLNVSLFIQQLLQLYMLYCRKKEARELEVRFALPVEFPGGRLSTEEQNQARINALKDIYANATRHVADLTGFAKENVTIKFTTESEAVCAFFRKGPAFSSIDGQVGILTLDIGGGTSDYSFWTEKSEVSASQPAIAGYAGYSCPLAGHMMTIQVLIASLKTKADTLDWFCQSLINTKKSLPDMNRSYAFIDDCVKALSELRVDTGKTESEITFRFNLLMKAHGDVFKEALNDPLCEPLLNQMTFDLALLFFIAVTIYSQNAHFENARTQNGKPYAFTMCLAGNGANFYKLLPKARQESILKVVSEPKRVEVKLHQLVNEDVQKTEVALGMLYDDRIFDPSNASDNDNLTKISVADEFEKFMKKYIAQFPKDGHSEEMRKLLKAGGEWAREEKEQMIRRVGRIKDLNAYILEFREKMMNNR